MVRDLEMPQLALKEECRWPLEAGKGKETVSSRASRRNVALLKP